MNAFILFNKYLIIYQLKFIEIAFLFEKAIFIIRVYLIIVLIYWIRGWCLRDKLKLNITMYFSDGDRLIISLFFYYK